MVLVENKLKNAYIGEYVPFTPWANTLAYFPLAEDWLDKTGNYTLSNTWTAQTLWRRFTAQASLNSTPSNPRTTSWWVKIASASASWWQCWVLGIGWSYICYGTDNSKVYNKSLYIYVNANYYYSINLIDNQWHHIVLTNNWSNIIWYVDWVAHSLWNPSIPNFWNNLVYCSWSNTIDVTLSEFIIENKQRTAQEILNYYNNTKSNYWL